jgi:hypothetical protein
MIPVRTVRKTDQYKTQYEEGDVGEGGSFGDKDVKERLK